MSSYWTQRRKLHTRVHSQLEEIADNVADETVLPRSSTVSHAAPSSQTESSQPVIDDEPVYDDGGSCYGGLFEEFDCFLRTGCHVVSIDADSDDDCADHSDAIGRKLASWAAQFSITLVALGSLLDF